MQSLRRPASFKSLLVFCGNELLWESMTWLQSPGYHHARLRSLHPGACEKGSIEGGCHSVMELVEVLHSDLPDQIGICMHAFSADCSCMLGRSQHESAACACVQKLADL